MLCVSISPGRRHPSYVDKYERITLRWGYRRHKVGHPGLHNTGSYLCCMLKIEAILFERNLFGIGMHALQNGFHKYYLVEVNTNVGDIKDKNDATISLWNIF